jgi:hypothetical protein
VGIDSKSNIQLSKLSITPTGLYLCCIRKAATKENVVTSLVELKSPSVAPVRGKVDVWI